MRSLSLSISFCFSSLVTAFILTSFEKVTACSDEFLGQNPLEQRITGQLDQHVPGMRKKFFSALEQNSSEEKFALTLKSFEKKFREKPFFGHLLFLALKEFKKPFYQYKLLDSLHGYAVLNSLNEISDWLKIEAGEALKVPKRDNFSFTKDAEAILLDLGTPHVPGLSELRKEQSFLFFEEYLSRSRISGSSRQTFRVLKYAVDSSDNFSASQILDLANKYPATSYERYTFELLAAKKKGESLKIKASESPFTARLISILAETANPGEQEKKLDQFLEQKGHLILQEEVSELSKQLIDLEKLSLAVVIEERLKRRDQGTNRDLLSFVRDQFKIGKVSAAQARWLSEFGEKDDLLFFQHLLDGHIESSLTRSEIKELYEELEYFSNKL